MNDTTTNAVALVFQMEGLPIPDDVPVTSEPEPGEDIEQVRQEVELGEQQFADLAEAIHGKEFAFLMQHPREWSALCQVKDEDWKVAVRERIEQQAAEFKQRSLDAAILVIKH